MKPFEELPEGNVHAGYVARDRYKNSLIKHKEGTHVRKAIEDCFKDLIPKRYDEEYVDYCSVLSNTLGIDVEKIKEFSTQVMKTFGFSRDAYLANVYEERHSRDSPNIRFYENPVLLPLTCVVQDWYDMVHNERFAVYPEIRGGLAFPGLPFAGWHFQNPAGYLTDRLKRLKDDLPTLYSKDERTVKNIRDAVAMLAERGIKSSEEEIVELGVTGQIATSYLIGIAFSQLGGKDGDTREDRSLLEWYKTR